MPYRKSLICTLWLASALALLASLVGVSTRTSGLPGDSPRPDGIHSGFERHQGQSTALLVAATPTDADPQVNALPSEDEEQDRADALVEPLVTSVAPYAFRHLPDRQSITPRPVPSLYPLRC